MNIENDESNIHTMKYWFSLINLEEKSNYLVIYINIIYSLL